MVCFQGGEKVAQAGRVFGMAKDGDNAFKRAPLGRLGEGVGLRAVAASVQLLMQRIKVGAEVAGKLQCGALTAFAVAGILPSLVQSIGRKGLLEQVTDAFHKGKAPRRSSTTWCLLEKGRPENLAKACAKRRKTPP